MVQVVVSIGSNIERERHVLACLDALHADFTHLEVSRVFESEPVGFEDGRNFYNLIAAFESQDSEEQTTVAALQNWCKRLEFAYGRRADSAKFSPRTLDVDLLTVGELVGNIAGVTLPRDEITSSAFVLQPLAELLPNARHPVSGIRYADLWAAFDSGGQRLWPVDFKWRGRLISRAA